MSCPCCSPDSSHCSPNTCSFTLPGMPAWEAHDPTLTRPIAASLEWCAELLGVDLDAIQEAAAHLEPYLRVDGTRVWSLMQLERQLRPTPTVGSAAATSPVGGHGPPGPCASDRQGRPLLVLRLHDRALHQVEGLFTVLCAPAARQPAATAPAPIRS
jgi:hypothetical protein